MNWKYGPDWYYENPRNGYQDWHNRYYEYRRKGTAPPSALSQADSNRWKYELAGVPILGDFIRASDNTRYMNDYLKNRGMTWADVKYPSRVSGSGSSARAIAGVGDAIIGGSLLRRMYRRNFLMWGGWGVQAHHNGGPVGSADPEPAARIGPPHPPIGGAGVSPGGIVPRSRCRLRGSVGSPLSRGSKEYRMVRGFALGSLLRGSADPNAIIR